MRLSACICVLLGACQGQIGGEGSDGGPPSDTRGRDGGPDAPFVLGDCTDDEMELQRGVGTWLQNTCAHAGCHGPVGERSPSLAAADLASLVDRGFVVPGDPTRGRIMARIASDDPLLIMPPSVPENDETAVEMVEEWINIGAPTNCVAPPPRPAPSPNSHDQDTLFTCTDPVAFGPELALMNRTEIVHRTGSFLSEPSMQSNPFPSVTPLYSTSTVGRSFDATSLGLYLDVLGLSRDFRRTDRRDLLALRDRRGPNSANNLWRAGLSEEESVGLECFESGTPDDACKDAFVRLLLERYALQRRPTEREVDLILSFLEEELAIEVERDITIDHLQEASLMLSGAIYRTIDGGEDGTLSVDEWGLALAGALSSAPHLSRNYLGAPRPELAWSESFVQGRDSGALEDRAAAQSFIETVLDIDEGYVGGLDAVSAAPARPDIVYDDSVVTRNAPERRRLRRGRYWLAPRLAQFFREYFDYGDLVSRAKDEPLATSRWDDERVGSRDLRQHSNGYQRNKDANAIREPGLEDQMDDFIAREVVLAEQEGRDVFTALLTGRTYRVPASISAVNGARTIVRSVVPSGSCDPLLCRPDRDGVDACCDSGTCFFEGFDDAGAPVGSCIGSSERVAYSVASVYDTRPITETSAVTNALLEGSGIEDAIRNDSSREARWVEMPASARSGALTHPAWLSAHGGNAENGPAAIERGKWVREHLFCEDVAGLDLVGALAVQFVEGSEDLRARERLIATFGDLSLPVADRTAPDLRCANQACHGRMNNLGLAFEIFNHAGFVRYDDHGQPPSGQTLIRSWPGQDEAVEVSDAVELSQMLAADPHARRCFLRHVFRFFARRAETPADACVLAEMESAYDAEGGSLLAALSALLTSDSHMTRDITGAGR